jgi:hypothetical protein
MTLRVAVSKAPGGPANGARQNSSAAAQSSYQTASPNAATVADAERKEWVAGTGSHWSFSAVPVHSRQSSFPMEGEPGWSGGLLQRKCAACEKEEEEKVSRKALDGRGACCGTKAPPIVNAALTESGRPLTPGAREFFESRFGADFSKVRIHTGGRAADAASAVRARAFTVGREVVFGAGQYAPATAAGSRLVAHELAHVVQQGRSAATLQHAGRTISSPSDPAELEAERASATIARGGKASRIVEHPSSPIARAAFDLDGIVHDADTMADAPVQIGQATRQMSALFIKYHFAPAAGDLTFAADYPSAFTPPADKTKAVSPIPKADTAPTKSNIPVQAFFFPATWPTKRRALVLGGFHGDEHPGWEMVEGLVDEMKKGNFSPAFHTIVVPRVNAGGIQDELNNVHLWHNRCNRQVVDLNRNFPVAGQTPKATDCPNTVGAPIQPETQAVMDLVTKFKPDRIVSAHDTDTVKQAGVYADPNQDPAAVALARGMASTIVNPSDRPGNKLSPTTFNPVYPGDKPGVVGAGTSLGAWGPTAVSGRTTPVITIEAPGDQPLSQGPGTKARTVEAFERPLHAFLTDPADLETEADRDILRDIDTLNAADRVAFLTGHAPVGDAITERIRQRVLTAVAKLQSMGPPTALNAESHVRLAETNIPGVKGGTAQAQIDFEKFFLVGSRSNGWDTLPAQFWVNNQVGGTVDSKKWLAAPSKDRLEAILKYSSLPGASRHHWATEVDFNSTDVADWLPGKRLAPLGTWLDANASKAGLLRAYTPGRTGGYNDEPWHFSYAPISVGLRERYNQEVNLKTDVVDKVVADFAQRAAAKKLTVPSDFATAVGAINISDLVNNIGPGL